MNKTLLSISVILILILTGCSETNYDNSVTFEISRENILSDLKAYEEELLEIHPALQSEQLRNELSSDFEKLESKIENNMDQDRLVWEVKKILSKLGDEHTNIRRKKTPLIIPVKFQYTEDGLVALNNFDILSKGDKIKKIGNKNFSQIMSELRLVSPIGHDTSILGANIQRGLHTELVLKNLGLVDADSIVRIDFEDESGSNLSIDAPFINNTVVTKESYEFAIDTDASIGVFTMRNYMELSKFRGIWKEFIGEIDAQNIKTILIDLRESTGGYSEYQFTDTIFSSIGIKEYRTPYPEFYKDFYKKTEVLNVTRNSNPIFIDNLYVATSNYTVSAPTIFATIVKENAIGKILGEPVANNLSFYASIPFEFEFLDMEASIGSYYVKYSGKAETEFKPLSPDVNIPFSSEDIRYNKDPILTWIKSNLTASNVKPN